MRDRRAVVRVLAFLVLVVVVTVSVWNLLSGQRFSGGETHRALFTDVSGMEAGDDVRVAGVAVGRVQDIRLERRSLALVTFTVDRGVPLTTSSTATVKYKNLTGNRYLSLGSGTAGTGGRLGEDAVIPVARTAPALDLDALFGGFQPLLDALSPQQVNQLSEDLVRVLQGEGGTVMQLLQNIGDLTTRLASRDAVIGQVVTNLTTVLATAQDHSDEISRSLVQLQTLATGLADQRTAFVAGLASTSELAGQTSALLEQLRPPLMAAADQTAGIGRTLTSDRNAPTVDKTLKFLPEAYLRISGVGSYGTFYNFYICGIGLTYSGADGGVARVPFENLGDARCRK